MGAWGSAFSAITRFAVIKRAESRLSEWFEDRDDGLELNNGEVNFSDVSLNFEDRAIFDNFELHFKSDLIYIIKGENGAGKSTVFKLITGLINADSGQILISFYIFRRRILSFLLRQTSFTICYSVTIYRM